MFESITKTKVASVSDPERKNRMIEALCEAHIKYYIKCKDINHRNLFDTAKIGRNDPCPCSSGKKYKKCCGR